MSKRKCRSQYHPAPKLPVELEDRYVMVMAALTGVMPVSEAARQAGLSRNYFQTVMHRSQQALMDALTPKSAGRPTRSEREVQLEREVEQLTRQNQRLQQRVETIDRLLDVASQTLQGKLNPMTRRPKSRGKRTATTPGDGGDDSDGAGHQLEAATTMRQLGLTPRIAAALVGASASTVRRWAARRRSGLSLRRRRGPRHGRPVTSAVRTETIAAVRATRGLIGADALRHRVTGLSRRQALAIKQATLTEMERDRRAQCTCIRVLYPGIIRGFDALETRTEEGRRYVLAAADACVPYRTMLAPRPAYDTLTVASVLEQDFEEHGPPIVLRLDRAKAHRTSQVMALLAEHRVLVLHGPPRYPRFYGQLERQNREHRAWLDAVAPTDDELLIEECAAMKQALNGLWPRRTLGWLTPEEAWMQRPALDIDRAELQDHVAERVERLRRHDPFRDAPTDIVERIAIEQELINHGLMSRVPGGWC
jgi:transposase